MLRHSIYAQDCRPRYVCVAVGCVWLLAVCGLTGSGWRLGCVPHTVRAIQRNRAFEFLKHDIVTAQPKAAILYDTGPVCGLVHASGDPHTTTRVCRQRGKHRQRSGWQKQACCECACYHQLLLGQVACAIGAVSHQTRAGHCATAKQSPNKRKKGLSPCMLHPCCATHYSLDRGAVAACLVASPLDSSATPPTSSGRSP